MSHPTAKSRFLVPGRRTLRIAVCALAALLAYAALPAFSDDEPRDTDYERGMAADEEKDYELAAKRFLKSAERGNPNAQFKLAKYYANGQGVQKDSSEAVKWYRKAAEQGHAKAQNNLAVAYFNGEGVEKNQEEAVKWLLKAAESGCDVAQKVVGDWYRRGLYGIEQDSAKAAELYTKAAEQGYSPAQINLGVMYLNGEGGLERDLTKGGKLLLSAAREKNEEGAFLLAELYRKDFLDPVQIEGIPSSPSKWYLVAAEQGNVEAQYQLGIDDIGGSKKWLLKAAKNGHLWAMYLAAMKDDINDKNRYDIRYSKQDWANDIKSAQSKDPDNPDLLFWLAIGYQTGLGMDINYGKAWNLFCEAAEKGNDCSQNILGQTYAKGGGSIEKDEKKAFEWFKKSAEQGYAMGQFNLAECYANGRGVEEDEDEAIKWYKKAVECRYSNSYGGDNSIARRDAAYQLGILYEKGWGVEKDLEQAFQYYRISIKNIDDNHFERQLKIAQCYENGIGTAKDLYTAERMYESLCSRLRPSSTADRKVWAEANYRLAMILADRIKTQQFPSSDDTDGFSRHLKNAAKEGHEEAQKYCRDHNISW